MEYIELASIEKISEVPSVWKGFTFDGDAVVIRYQNGVVSVKLNDVAVFSEEIDETDSNTMPYETLKRGMVHWISFPQEPLKMIGENHD